MLYRHGSTFHSVKPKITVSAFGNGLALTKILNAIPLPSFSTALNSAPQYLIFLSLPSVLVPALISDAFAKSCSIQQSRLTASDTLEERSSWLNLRCRFNHHQKPSHRNRNNCSSINIIDKESAVLIIDRFSKISAGK
jgi:hypothetical protein